MLGRWLACLALPLALVGCTENTPSTVQSERCPGITYAEVNGRAPALGRPALRGHAVSGAVCSAYWVPQVDRGFVPQGLEIDDRTAFVGGYDGKEPVGRRWCQVVTLDLETGKVTAFARWFGDAPRRTKATACRHGGGLELNDDGLWVAGYDRLWLLDPDDLRVRRGWWLGAGVRGSTLVVDGDRIGIGGFDPDREAPVWWFDRTVVLQAGRTVLPAPSLTGRAPAGLQGMTVHDGRSWFVSSTSRCGTIRMGRSGAVGFVPGAEDVEIRGQDLWTVSESGTRDYLDPDEKTVPALLRVDLAAVRAGDPTDSCG